MATLTLPTFITRPQRLRLSITTIVGLAAVLAPLGYIVGRGTADHLAIASLGALLGIPVGLFFGSLRSQLRPAASLTAADRATVLAKIAAELTQSQTLFEARKGATNLYARIAYPTPFWAVALASGQIAAITNANTLQAVATAYYWLDQASRLELLAYEAKYAQEPASDSLIRATHLISDVRLLDGQLEAALSAALAALSAV
jgi:hypothetical protein